MTWTPDMKREALRLAKLGFSSREIGDRIGKSKSQVHGVLTRMGFRCLTARADSAKLKHWHPKPSGRGAAPEKVLALEPDQCRWPSGDPKLMDFHFCGAPSALGSAYCRIHKRKSESGQVWHVL